MENKVYVICGPTASGKSSLAIDMALKNNGVIINADSQQVYRELPILTACPSVEDYEQVPHKLYQYVDGNSKMDAGLWAAQAAVEINKAFELGQMPIVVGGTGFYIKALVEGLSVVPEVALKIRELLRKETVHMKNEDLHKILEKYDPELAAKTLPSNRQRVKRGIEVFRASGVPLSTWQRQKKIKPLEDVEFDLQFVDFPMETLERRIAKRTDLMLNNGMVEEVEALFGLGYYDDAPIFKVIGVEAVKNYIDGKLSKVEMTAEIILRSRQYAKRQRTFFKTQFSK